MLRRPSATELNKQATGTSKAPKTIAEQPTSPSSNVSPVCLIQLQHLNVLRQLGKGSFGSVSEARWTKADGQAVSFCTTEYSGSLGSLLMCVQKLINDSPLLLWRFESFELFLFQESMQWKWEKIIYDLMLNPLRTADSNIDRRRSIKFRKSGSGLGPLPF